MMILIQDKNVFPVIKQPLFQRLSQEISYKLDVFEDLLS